jgi:hypothetical protein
MLHLEGHAVEPRARHRHRALDVDGCESDESGLALLEGFDNAIQAGYFRHLQLLMIVQVVQNVQAVQVIELGRKRL